MADQPADRKMTPQEIEAAMTAAAGMTPEDTAAPGASDAASDAAIEAAADAILAAAGGGAAAGVGPTSSAATAGAAHPVDPHHATIGTAIPDTFVPPDFGSAPHSPAPSSPLDLLDDVELEVKIELGRTEMYIEDVLRLSVGSVVELNKLAGDPVEVYVNERLVARGEVLVLNENFCVRVNDIINPMGEFDHR